MLSKPLFREQFAGLCELFDKICTETLTTTYYESLKNMTDIEFKAAVKVIVDNEKFMPKPEAFRKGAADKALLAYEKAINAGRQHGCYQSIKFDDPAIHSTIELMGGWEKFCLSDEDRKWQGKEFEKIYLVMMKRDNHPTHLIGRFEAVNGIKGYNVQPPILIGKIGQKSLNKGGLN